MSMRLLVGVSRPGLLMFIAAKASAVYMDRRVFRIRAVQPSLISLLIALLLLMMSQPARFIRHVVLLLLLIIRLRIFHSDLFRGSSGYKLLVALQNRAHAFSQLARSQLLPCGDRETQLWKANATYWSQECSSSDADLRDLKATASNAIKETYVPWDDPVFFEASSAYCPSLRRNLFPGFTRQSQFRFLVKLIELRAQHAARAADSQQIFNPDELELVPIYAHRFQRFTWRYFARTNIASDDFARELFLDTVATCARASCQAGANDDDDDPVQKPRRTRKRRTEELEARPARRQHAKEEVASAPIDPPFPSSAETPAPVEEEQDVNMEPSVSSQATPDPTAATTTSDRPAHDTHAAETTSDRSNQHDANSQR